jgi:hypothetical protein
MGTSLHDDDGHDHAVNTEDTSHDHRHNWLHDEFGLEDTHRADSDSSLGTTIGSTEVGEDEGGGDSDVAEEVLWAVCGCTLHELIYLINNITYLSFA